MTNPFAGNETVHLLVGGENYVKWNFYVKVLSIVLVEGITLLFGFIPLLFNNLKSDSQILSLSNAFSGGLFMGIGLFHLLPEANALIEGGRKSTEIFPLGYFMAFVSYSIILWIEKVLFHSQSLTDHIDSGDESNDHLDIKEKKETEPLLVDYKKEIEEAEENIDEETLKHVVSSKGQFASFLHARNIMADPEKRNRLDKTLLCASKMLSQGYAPKDEEKINKRKQSHSFDYMDHVEGDKRCKPTSNITPYILLIALSIHGIFEGTALGVQDSLKETIFISVAILAHKWAEGFALGISFVSSQTDKSTLIKMILLFSIFTPSGIIIGMFFTSASEFYQGIMLSISSGTFLYVSASEVIIEEFAIARYKGKKYVMFLVGGLFVAGITYLELFQNSV